MNDYISINEVNSILTHDGINPCYFGECSESLSLDMTEINTYHPEEINGVYTNFLRINNLLLLDFSILETSAINHIMHHFIQYLISFKRVELDSRRLCMLALNKRRLRKRVTCSSQNLSD